MSRSSETKDLFISCALVEFKIALHEQMGISCYEHADTASSSYGTFGCKWANPFEVDSIVSLDMISQGSMAISLCVLF